VQLPCCYCASLRLWCISYSGALAFSCTHAALCSLHIRRNCTRTVHLGSAVALHCAARTAGDFSSMIILTVSRPVRSEFLMVLTVGVVTSPRISPVSCASSCTRQGFSLGLIPERTYNLHSTLSGSHLSLSAAAYGRYERGYHSQKQATPGFSLGDH
jgi:hypothetical protein